MIKMSKTCNGCGEDMQSVPYIVYESEKARDERSFRRMWILIIVLISLLVGTNAAWLWYESQQENITIEQKSDDYSNNFIASGGDIINGSDANS